jgi:hypothetical protein
MVACGLASDRAKEASMTTMDIAENYIELCKTHKNERRSSSTKPQPGRQKKDATLTSGWHRGDFDPVRRTRPAASS